MTPYEQGYDAYLKGQGQDKNPFGKETDMYGNSDNKSPWSEKKWAEGWKKAQADRSARR